MIALSIALTLISAMALKAFTLWINKDKLTLAQTLLDRLEHVEKEMKALKTELVYRKF